IIVPLAGTSAPGSRDALFDGDRKRGLDATEVDTIEHHADQRRIRAVTSAHRLDKELPLFQKNRVPRDRDRLHAAERRTESRSVPNEVEGLRAVSVHPR